MKISISSKSTVPTYVYHVDLRGEGTVQMAERSGRNLTARLERSGLIMTDGCDTVVVVNPQELTGREGLEKMRLICVAARKLERRVDCKHYEEWKRKEKRQ